MKKICILFALCAMMVSAKDMALIPAGTFTMGDAKSKNADEAPHEVTLSAFYMDKCEVTQAEFAAVMGQNPSRFQNDNAPVERIRWTDAALYCNKRSQAEGLKPCYTPRTWECDFEADGYRLPTEAEWEYACRAGSKGKFYFDGTEKQLSDYAWLRNNSDDRTNPVGKKKANAFGLFDMYGNVCEWCNDFYEAKPAGGKDPKGPAKGAKRVLRGGSWQDRPKNITSSFRKADDPATADICQGYDTYGFRCVRKAVKKDEAKKSE